MFVFLTELITPKNKIVDNKKLKEIYFDIYGYLKINSFEIKELNLKEVLLHNYLKFIIE